MINASKEFKEKLKNGANLVNYADITLSNGEVIHLEPKHFMLGGCVIEDKATDGKFGVGYAIGKTLSIKIANYDESFSDYDFYNSVIYLYVALLLDDGRVEKIRKGVYYATVPQTPGNIIEISAVDGMYLLDRPYNASTSYPATLQQIISDCCLDCGIPIGFKQFDNYGYVVQECPEGLTYRQVISYACQIAGCNAHIDTNGYMDLVWYNSAIDSYFVDGGDYKYQEQPVIDGGNFTDYSADLVIDGGLFTDDTPENVYRIKTLNVHTDDVVITGVRVTLDDTEILFGEDGYVVQIKDNPFTSGKEQEVCYYLGAKLVGMTFRPFSAQVLNNPLYEPFEVVRVYDRKGNEYISVINSVSYSIGSYTTISCEAEDPVRNGSRYFSQAAQAVVEARRNTEKQLSNYDKAVQNLTNLMTNSFGVFKSEEVLEDGSVLYYLHNKPTLEESDTIWKMAADGFAVSTDGGKTWGAGMDSDGNAVVNVLSAIGINADWIHTGTLTVGGFNNTNGQISILDASGEQVGVINNNGIYFFSNETQLQVIISPTVGIIQRDAEGNEYNGLVFDKIVQLPSLATKKTLFYASIDSDFYDFELIGDWQSGYKYKYTGIHNRAYWQPYISYAFSRSELILHLPETFKGKKWIVYVNYKGKNDNELEYTPLCEWSYSKYLPKCVEGITLVSSNSLDDPVSEMQKNAPVTKYLSIPEPSSGSYNASAELSGEITEHEIDFSYDEEEGTLTITGYAKDGNWLVNEQMDIRVTVSC